MLRCDPTVLFAKWESRDSSSHHYYNQFANGKNDGSVGAHGAKGWPFYSPEEKNGWGMFQRDPTDGGIPVTIDQVWNWHTNVQVAVQQELVEKQTTATSYLQSVGSSPPTYTTGNGMIFSAKDTLTMERYNGANGRKNSQLLIYTPGNPPGVGIGKQWRWNLPNAPSKPGQPPNPPYVDCVASVMATSP